MRIEEETKYSRVRVRPCPLVSTSYFLLPMTLNLVNLNNISLGVPKRKIPSMCLDPDNLKDFRLWNNHIAIPIDRINLNCTSASGGD